ncbi:hypothetical protein [Sphingobium yanoikuyae]|uniref:hypothetical protein n=1 Tax=Sphingobium yanoikuyae TaxID=13690 RepID=UPI001110633F|nr:hypothetical protein [Sphingobium yanoikuyae]
MQGDKRKAEARVGVDAGRNGLFSPVPVRCASERWRSARLALAGFRLDERYQQSSRSIRLTQVDGAAYLPDFGREHEHANSPETRRAPAPTGWQSLGIDSSTALP